ncbi:MAG: hypothetical protein ABMB14_30910 [Myxococcota bacterium]
MYVRAIAALGFTGLIGIAWADSTDGGPPSVADGRLKCRTFPTEIGAEIDTRDGDTPLGQWVIGLEDRGWTVANVAWEVGQKPTGFPQGYTHVCLAPVSN